MAAFSIDLISLKQDLFVSTTRPKSASAREDIRHFEELPYAGSVLRRNRECIAVRTVGCRPVLGVEVMRHGIFDREPCNRRDQHLEFK